jgi:meiotic recombination protein DMC1
MQKTNKEVDMDCEEEESLVSSSIDKLQEFGVNAADINKLKAAGICTVKGLLMVTRKELLNIKGISDQKVDKMIEAAQKSEVRFKLN